jgi:non-heme chloroperoxidase
MFGLLIPLGLAAGGIAGAKRMAGRLAARPDRYPAWVLATEPVGESVWIDRPDGTRIRAVVAGEGRIVVLAHGYGGSLLLWNLVAERLVELGYRVICFDQRGHELSTIGSDGIGTMQMAGDYLAVLEHFEVTDGILVGHSMGGFLAIAAVLDVPGVAERLGGLVLISAFAGRVLDGAPQNRVQIPLLKKGVIQKIASTPTGGMLFGASLTGADPSPAEIRTFLDVFVRQDHSRLIPMLEAFSEEDRYPRLGAITVPTAVVCGRQDRTTPPLHSERLASGIPGAEMIWSERAGHTLNWEAPELVVMAVRELS